MGATTFGRASQLAFEVHARLATELKLQEEELYQKPEAAAHEYVQVTSDGGAMWTSRSLAGETLPTGSPIVPRDAEGHPPRIDTVKLPSGVEVRRVTIRGRMSRGIVESEISFSSVRHVPRTRYRLRVRSWDLPGRPRAPRPGGGGGFFRPPPDGPENTIPVFYIQCAGVPARTRRNLKR